MHRTDHITADPDANGPGLAGYTGGNSSTQTPATVLSPAAVNSFQEEIANVIELGNAGLVKAENDQLARMFFGHLDGVGLQSLKVNITVASSDWTGAAAGIDAATQIPILVVTRYKTTNQVYSLPYLGSELYSGAAVLTPRVLGSASANQLNAVAWSPELNLFCVVGAGGEIQTSPDSITWTRRTPAAAFAGTFQDVMWDAPLGIFVAAGASGTIQYSDNGSSWTAATAAGGYTDTFFSVKSHDGTFVLVGTSGEIQTSINGISWTRRVTGLAYNFYYAGASSFGFYAMAPSNSHTYFSSDSVTWGEVSLGFHPQTVSHKSGALVSHLDVGSTRFAAVHGATPKHCPIGTNIYADTRIFRTSVCWVVTISTSGEVLISQMMPW